MNRIMTSAPAEAARWMYQLGLQEAKAVPMTQQQVESQQFGNKAAPEPSVSSNQHIVPRHTHGYPNYSNNSSSSVPNHSTPQPQLPRGMQVQGGSVQSAMADWQALDNRIDAMSMEQLNEFRKNPANNRLYERMLRFGTTNPNPPQFRSEDYF